MSALGDEKNEEIKQIKAMSDIEQAKSNQHILALQGTLRKSEDRVQQQDVALKEALVRESYHLDQIDRKNQSLQAAQEKMHNLTDNQESPKARDWLQKHATIINVALMCTVCVVIQG